MRGNKRPTRCNRWFLTAELIVRSTYFGHHYAHHQELKSTVRYLLLLVLGALVYRLSVWCGAVCYEPGLRDAAGFHKRCGIFYLAEKPVACQTGPCSI
jgi:hypothetical protein